MKFYRCEGRVTQEMTNFYDYLGDSNLETGRYHLKSGVSNNPGELKACKWDHILTKNSHHAIVTKRLSSVMLNSSI